MVLKSFRSILIVMLVCFLSVGFACAAQKAAWKVGVAVSLTGVFGKDGSLVKDAYTL